MMANSSDKPPLLILSTKLRPPGLKPNSLRRERLLRLLRNNLEKKLVLISADAGYGKTTLLVQALQDAHLPGVFYGLDRGDSDFPVFFSYLVHGIEELAPGLIPRTVGLLNRKGEVGNDLKLAMGTLINELVEKRREEMFLLFDDYQVLAVDSPVHQAMEYFIDHLPEKVHIVISSRTEPPLPNLAKWRAKRDLFELTREDLTFSDDEVKTLLREAYRRGSTEEELRQVRDQTEGWITGIQLILQSAGKGGKTIRETLAGYLEANHPLFDYFIREVLAGEPREVQDFLKGSALLDILTPEACGCILGTKNPEALLKGLERRNLFLCTAGKGQYKYHHLFREFLMEVAEPGTRMVLHLRAAEYYEKLGMVEEAIEHALRGGSYDLAGKLIVQVSEDMKQQARFKRLGEWLRQIPGPVFEKMPSLLAVRGALLTEKGDLTRAEQSYLRAESKLAQDGTGKQDRTQELADIRLALARIHLMRGNHEKALKALGKALRAYPSSELKGIILNTMGVACLGTGDLKKGRTHFHMAKRIFERLQDPSKLISVDANLAAILDLEGETRKAFQVYRPLIGRLGSEYFLRAGVFFSNAARLALNVGETVWAEECLRKGWSLCESYEDPISRAALYDGLGILAVHQARWEEAREHLEKARERFAQAGWSKEESVVLGHLARLHRYQGDLAKAGEALDAMRQKITNLESGSGAAFLAERALLEASKGEYRKAEETLKMSLRMAQKFGRIFGVFLSHLAGAETQLGQRKKTEALRWLGLAVRRAKQKGYDGILASELRHSADLQNLARKMARSPGQNYLRGILEKTGTPSHRKDGKPFLEAEFFGALEISLTDGRAVPVKWNSRKAASLFAYLLLNRNRACEREELMEAFWPRATREQGERNLHTTISRIKKALATGLQSSGEKALARTLFVVREEGGYRIAPLLSFRLDVEDFLTRWQEARRLEKEGKADDSHKGYERCAEIYRDRFLPNLTERWCEERREEYEKIHLSCLRKLAACRMGRKDYEEAAAFFRRYLAREPYCEEVHREFWKSLTALGLKADILRDYKELKRILRTDLGEDTKRESEEAFREAMSS